MKKLLPLLVIVISTFSSYSQLISDPVASATTNSDWIATKITPNNSFNNPWEITFGPDGELWISDRSNEKLVRFNTTTGVITDMININGVTSSAQGGVLGMAIHPDLYDDITTTTNNYVFSAYTYNDGGDLKLRIVRLVYDNSTGTLAIDTTLPGSDGAILQGLPASGDHNSGRLIIGPDKKLYYTIGENGANQFDYRCNPILSQVLPTSFDDYENYPGKTLRLNIDGTIPSDNPSFNGVQSHVNTYGHRNAQGIVFAQDGTLYSSEQGPKTDDEINIIQSGKDYGWPEIAGYYDNNYTYCNWSTGNCGEGFTDHNCPTGATTMTEYESYPTSTGAPVNFNPPIGTYGSSGPVGYGEGWELWPTVAPSSIDIHETGNIPNWGRSLLIPSLKKGTIYRAKLNLAGNDIIGDDDVSLAGYEEFHTSHNRYRDIAISPDGLTIYAVTDSSGQTSGPSTANPTNVDDPGVIIKIQYNGPSNTAAPTVVCKPISITLDATGNATITDASLFDNGSTSNITNQTLTFSIDRDTFTCADTEDPQQVILTVSDAEFNKSTCTALVTVIPNSSPNPIVAPTLEDIVSNCSVTVEAPSITSNACALINATTNDATTYNSGESGVITWRFVEVNGGDTTTVYATQNVTINTLNIPTNIIVSNIGANSASIDWDAATGVTYEVRFKPTSGLDWITASTSTNSIFLTGLEVSTNYDVEVQAICGAGNSSGYTSTSNFLTTDVIYCVPEINGGYYGGDYWISNVTLKNNIATELLNNDSDDSDDVMGYSDHTTGEIVPDLAISNSFVIEVTLENTHPWNKTTGHSVWIDYNQDGDFEDVEEKVWGTSENTDLFAHGVVAQGSFIIPATATLGNTIMRVFSRTYYTNEDSCEMNFTDGNNKAEYEDYTVNIIGSGGGGGTNTAPVATNDAFSIDENDTLLANVLIANPTTADIDSDGDTLLVTFFKVGTTTYTAGSTAYFTAGELTITTNGDLSFVSTAAYTETIPAISYTLSDGVDIDDTPTITITVNEAITTWTGNIDTNWNNADNWTNGIPNSEKNAVIPDVANDPIIASITGATVKNINITGILTIESGGSIIVSGTSTGNMTYNRALTADWHYISSPVIGQSIKSFVVNTEAPDNQIDISSGTSAFYGFAPYSNDGSNWNYYSSLTTAIDAAGNLETGKGYEVLRNTAGNVSFTGSINTGDVSIPVLTTGNKWNLIGNPYPAYIFSADIIAANATALGAAEYQSVYVWDATANSGTGDFIVLNNANLQYVSPAQGFFVNTAGGNAISITESMQVHQPALFFRGNGSNRFEIEMQITDGSSIKSTDIKYIDGSTRGLDPGYDAGVFSGTKSSFNVYSHLLDNNKGVDLKLQVLPADNFEKMVVPLGLNAIAGKEVTFTINTKNIPNDLMVFIEDKETNTFTRLDNEDALYKIALTSNSNGTGRFYLHTTASKSLSVEDENLENTLVYLSDRTIRIKGIEKQEMSVKVYNMLGQQMLFKKLNEDSNADIVLPASISNGVYIVDVQTSTSRISKKIIVQ